MAIISFDENINQQIQERNQLLVQLQNKGSNRFNYPSTDNYYQFDELSKMLPFSWSGIEAPLLSFSTDYGRDIAIHKFVNVGGAQIEDTGRNPLIMTAEIPFINTITPGGNEGWEQGTLYPNIYDQFLQSLLSASNSGETRVLNHPELGNINCKVTTFKTTLNPGYRGGAIISAQWIEDGLDIDGSNTFIDNLNNASSNVTKLNQFLDDLSPDPTALQLKPVALGFFGLLNKIKSLVDQTALIYMQVIGLLEQASYQCTSIIRSIDRANNMIYAKLLNVTYSLRADFIFTAEKLQKELPVSASRSIEIYQTTSVTTLAALSVIVSNTVSELMELNPILLATPFVRSNTKVKYYSGGLTIKPNLPKV